MQDGWIKVAAAALDVQVADVEFQKEQCRTAIEAAAKAGARVLVLPELCLTGYSCQDLFFQDTLVKGAKKALYDLKTETEGKNLLVFLGLPYDVDGRRYDCTAVVFEGKILALIPKTRLSAAERRMFADRAETRQLSDGIWFGTDLRFTCPELPALTLGCELGQERQQEALLVVNPTAMPALAGQRQYRRTELLAHTQSHISGYVSAAASCRESTTDFVYSGHSLIVENGQLLAESQTMEEHLVLSEIDVQKLYDERIRRGYAPEFAGISIPVNFRMEETTLTRPIAKSPFVPENAEECTERCREILQIQAYGLARRLKHAHAQTAVVGLSGGLDSTLALLVMAKAADLLGWNREKLWAITMPCYGTTSRTRSNAELLARQLGCSFREIPIAKAVAQHFADIGLPEEDRSVTYENSQARERTQVLMDLSNRLNGMVVGTGDLSELALGWATYNGDHMSMYGVNADLPKTLIRSVVAYCAAQAPADMGKVLLDILDTPVSPELLPPQEDQIAQKTEDLVGPYALHDFFLYYILRWGFGPKKVYRLAKLAFRGEYSPEVLYRWLRNFYWRFFVQQFKRSCLPDGPKVGTIGLSPRGDWCMPSDAVSKLWITELEQL